MNVNQQIIAKRLGISISTVSLALRDAPQVAQETRQQVQALADELGYKLPIRRLSPNQEANPLERLAVLTRFELTNPFYTAVLLGAESECRRQHIALHYSKIDDLSPRTLRQYQESDAMLLVGTIDEATVVQLQGLNRPMVLVDNNLPHLDIDRVLTENAGGMRRAVHQLANWGHQRIALACCCPSDPSMVERRDGYRWAIDRLGLERIEINYTWPDQQNSLSVAVTRWLQTPAAQGVTAILNYNDEAAISLIHTLQDQGLRIPEDISVVGFDDIESACIVRPTLTTCHVERKLLGERGVQLLLARIANPTAPIQAIVHSTTFVERGSTRRLNEP